MKKLSKMNSYGLFNNYSYIRKIADAINDLIDGKGNSIGTDESVVGEYNGKTLYQKQISLVWDSDYSGFKYTAESDVNEIIDCRISFKCYIGTDNETIYNSNAYYNSASNKYNTQLFKKTESLNAEIVVYANGSDFVNNSQVTAIIQYNK